MISILKITKGHHSVMQSEEALFKKICFAVLNYKNIISYYLLQRGIIL